MNNTIILPSDEIKYLGMTFNKKFTFNNHINKTLKKAGMAYAKLKKFIHSRLLNKTHKMMVYKQYLRPIIQYGSPIWCNKNVTSSCQMDKLRLFERKIIRAASNTHRGRGRYKYVNNGVLYKNAGISRLDVHLVGLNIRFVDKCKNNSNEKIRNLSNTNYRDSGRYKMVSYLTKLKEENILLEDGKLLIFNKGYRETNKTVYNVNQ